MKKILLAFFLCSIAVPALASTCPVSNLQVKDNATTTANLAYGDAADASGNCEAKIIISPVEPGTPGTGFTQPTGGVGISGWLSGIYHALTNSLTINLPTGAASSTNQSSQITQETATAGALGTTSDTAYAGSGNSTISAAVRGIYAILSTIDSDIKAAIAAGTAYIGQVGLSLINSGSQTAQIGCDNFTPFGNDATSGSLQLVGLVSSKVVYICGFNAIASGTVSVKLVYGTGTNCVTSPHDITDTYDLTAQVGIVDRGPYYQGMKTAASNELCLNLSASTKVAGGVYWTQQ